MNQNTSKTSHIDSAKSNRCIFLIGFMASGKTTVGRTLAKRLNIPFIDTDKMIVERENRSIADIFATDGELYFRDLETSVIRELVQHPKHAVCSVGGGLAVREENRKLMKEAGVVIYLKTSSRVLLSRLKGDTTRPLVAGCSSDEQLLERIEELMSKREDLYLDAADLIISTENGNVSQTASQIIKKLQDS